MKKIVVELGRENVEHGPGDRYGASSLKYDFEENTELVLDTLVKATEDFPNIRVYRHIVTENVENERPYYYHATTRYTAERVFRLHIFYE